MGRKSKRTPYLAAGRAEPPADDLMRQNRMSRYGATDKDWRDQRWETPHGRLAIRGERWARLADHARVRLVGTREARWIDDSEWWAAGQYLDLRMAYLRAYGAPGLPKTLGGDEPFACPICGASAKCDPCASNWQHQVTMAMQSVWGAISDASVLIRFPLQSAIDGIIANPASSSDFIAEEALPHLVKPLRYALGVIYKHFSGDVRATRNQRLTGGSGGGTIANDKVVAA